MKEWMLYDWCKKRVGETLWNHWSFNCSRNILQLKGNLVERQINAKLNCHKQISLNRKFYELN